MNSMGETATAMYIDIVTMWGIRVPLAVILRKIASLGMYLVQWARWRTHLRTVLKKLFIFQ
jgi:Na+-driven multidrug efflux pump